MNGFRFFFCMRALLPALGALLALPASATSVVSVENVEVFQETLRHQGTDRKALFLRPAVPASTARAPAVILLPYLDGTPPEMANLTEIAKMVRDNGVWVILPEAINGYWNHTPNVADALSPLGAIDLHVGLYGGSAVDDVGFLSKLIDSVVARHPVDVHRIYMGGYSNGALMSERFACERPGKIAAAALASATMRDSLHRSCAPAVPIPMLFMHGTADQVAPYDGTTAVLSAPDTVAFWVARNGCGAAPLRSTLPDIEDDGTTTQVESWRGCAGGSGVDVYTVVNGGHTWPGTLDYTPALGRASQDFSATKLLWDFFSQFSRP